MRTLATGLALFLALHAGPAGALGRAPDAARLPEIFADCAGRLLAEMEHQWTLSDPAADETKRLRARIVELLEAVASPDAALHLTIRRAEARAAQRALLTNARRTRDAEERRWSLDRATRLTAPCRDLVLTGDGPAGG